MSFVFMDDRWRDGALRQVHNLTKSSLFKAENENIYIRSKCEDDIASEGERSNPF